MRFVKLAALVALSVPAVALAQANTASQQAQLDASSTQVTQFRQLYNAGRYQAITEMSAPAFQQTSTGSNFAVTLTAYHAKMGAYASQSLVGEVATDNQAGNFTTQSFTVTYANGSATESFVYQTIGGKQMLMMWQYKNLVMKP